MFFQTVWYGSFRRLDDFSHCLMFKKHVLPKKNVATFFLCDDTRWLWSRFLSRWSHSLGRWGRGGFLEGFSRFPLIGLAGHFGFDDWGRWNSWFLGIWIGECRLDIVFWVSKDLGVTVIRVRRNRKVMSFWVFFQDVVSSFIRFSYWFSSFWMHFILADFILQVSCRALSKKTKNSQPDEELTEGPDDCGQGFHWKLEGQAFQSSSKCYLVNLDGYILTLTITSRNNFPVFVFRTTFFVPNAVCSPEKNGMCFWGGWWYFWDHLWTNGAAQRGA